MKVFDSAFLFEVKNKLDRLADGQYVTAADLLTSLGVPAEQKIIMAFVLQLPGFESFESVKSKGIRRKKISNVA